VRVLLFDDRRSERDALAKALPAACPELEVVGDEPSAITAIMRDPPQVVVFAAPARGAEETVRRLRSFDASGQAYIVAILEGALSHKELSNLIAAGVNDFIRRPVSEPELIERVKAPTRMLRWVRSVARPTAFDFAAPVDAARLQGWQNLGALVAEDVGQVVGASFSVSSGWPVKFANGIRGATIPMSLAEDQLELRVSIGVDAEAGKWLASTLLGDPEASDASLEDALRELANTAGGALKRTALCESVTLTTGIPINERLANDAGRSCFTLLHEESGVCIAAVGEIRSKQNQRVAASNLSEGMIVVHDVRNEGGLLLVAAGSRLTSSSAARLSRALGSRCFLEVAPAA
jgi:CheY-like chemotaxis protein